MLFCCRASPQLNPKHSCQEVSCAFPRWSVANSAGTIEVAVLHARGTLVKHTTATFPASGVAADRTFLTSESWFSVSPVIADMASDTTFTVTGAGFELAVSYKCRLTTKVPRPTTSHSLTLTRTRSRSHSLTHTHSLKRTLSLSGGRGGGV